MIPNGERALGRRRSTLVDLSLDILSPESSNLVRRIRRADKVEQGECLSVAMSDVEGGKLSHYQDQKNREFERIVEMTKYISYFAAAWNTKVLPGSQR